MRIVSVDGKLQTQGSWSEEEAKAKQQLRNIAQLKADIRLILEGRPQEETKPLEFSITPAPESVTGYEQFVNRLNRKIVQACALTKMDYSAVEQRVHAQMTIKAARPPALWLRYDQIPEAERSNGLWHFKRPDGGPVWEARSQSVTDESYLYLRSANSVKEGDTYNSDLYTHPQSDGWFVHDPKPDSVCPVPFNLRIVTERRCGMKLAQLANDAYWPIGYPSELSPMDYDIVFWKVSDDTALSS